MRVLKTAVSVAAAAVTLLGAKAALATSGVVFIHGTGNQNGALTCDASHNCWVPAAKSNYWNQGEIDSIRGGRSYLVVGYSGGDCQPWAPARDPNDPNGTFGSCGSGSNNGGSGIGGTNSYSGLSNQSNGDAIVAQINYWMQQSGVNEIVMVTHSGGGNQARYILQNAAAKGTWYNNVKGATVRVVTIASPTLGTWLANETSLTFNINILGIHIGLPVGKAIADIAGFNGEGTTFIRTDNMAVYNGSGSYFGGVSSGYSQGGVTFYSTGGTSKDSYCYGVTIFGACIGVRTATLGPSTCDSLWDEVALTGLHIAFLDETNSQHGTNNCSDGFIPCKSAQSLGHNFAFNTKQDHNQSRRQCNGLDGQIASYVSGSYRYSGFSDSAVTSVTPVAQTDTCGFTQHKAIVDSSNVTHGYTNGCPTNFLGDGWCDWDCVAMYGNDATPVWDATGTVVTGWTGSGDCTTQYDSAGNPGWSNSPWGDAITFVENGTTYIQTFTGKSHNGYSTVWYTDPYQNSSNSSLVSLGMCPTSWVNDGYCDECALLQYGFDGADCVPGQINSCYGVLAKYDPWTAGPGDPLYNEYDPSNLSSGTGYGWIPNGAPGATTAAVANNGVCETSECTSNVAGSGSQCNTTADCQTGTCIAGGCTTGGNDCTATYSVQARNCATNADCNGNACNNPTGASGAGTCLATNGACTTDGDCPVPSGATSSCNSSGQCGCTTSADCPMNGACNAGVCASTTQNSLCR
jgi:hypothetical protein